MTLTSDVAGPAVLVREAWGWFALSHSTMPAWTKHRAGERWEDTEWGDVANCGRSQKMGLQRRHWDSN